MSLVTQIAALATRVATEIKLLRTEIPPDLPAYTPAGATTPMLTTDGNVASWATTPTFAYLNTTHDLTAGGVVAAVAFSEGVFGVTGTAPALSPANGGIQTWSLTANSTPTIGAWTDGQGITLMVDDGSAYAITWPGVTWKTGGGTAPTLNTTGYTVVALWKVGSTIYGARVGDA